MTLKLGDRVRIDIPDELDPDFNLHGEHPIVLDNDPSRCTCGCEVLYKVALETQALSIEMHPWDLRPPIEPMPPIESFPADSADEQ
ncbi:hypothetical protein HAPAU_34880 [Halalkalicoccus paucihalophilus]|uniref:DUF8139 domain-containing protein n=1 Tax=Halalkalicoccus paucihalophilus TaxID=1008153 RepID=A0A151AA41_9EURY|nr:hypothetical protein [Halalkalicoccus paucihalophilus]KYH24505.1 hypothetical protein HAPAU_34880 [Halalkalicoccus paucihalophilus]